MSADPPSSSGLPARSRPVLSDLSKQTTEEDLWDLDEEPAAPGTSTPEAHPASPSPADTEPPSPVREKPKPTVIGARLEKPEAKPKGIVRKDNERRKAADTFDELDGPPEAAAGTGESAPPTSPLEATVPADANPSASTAPEERPKEPTPKSRPPTSPKFSFNRREIVGLGVFAFAILLAAIWGLASFFGHLHFKDEDTGRVDFPVKGERSTITAAESFWREPIRTGENRDAAREAVAVIPVIEITLGADSGAGAMRVLFRNDRGEPVGDTITRTFSSGRFDNGSEKTECASSDGFQEKGDFNAFRAGQSKPWTVMVLEGPGPDAPASEFRTLFEMPLSSFFR